MTVTWTRQMLRKLAYEIHSKNPNQLHSSITTKTPSPIINI